MKNNIPLISVVTVSYNAVSTIEETILSVINQTYPNIEYIIIDGGSTDGTLDIIKKYEDKIAYWVSEPDKGIYDAMNKGIQKVSGEWINFMNSGDEFYDRDILNRIFLYGDWSKTDVICGDVSIKYPKREVVKKMLPMQDIEKGMVFCHQSSFTRTELHRNKLFNLTYKICADYDFFLQVYREGYSFSYINETISKFLYGGLSSDSMISLLVEVWHISGKKYNKHFMYVIMREFLLGKIRRYYLER
ncbi:Glycosyltransferase, group 2 family protein [Capnocytophaga canis]|uniref:Glycosyltransferase, group 2 family protein n=1 Tax=Capnocytophaga canis TaxID=1848903 RepID=A0A0B7HXU9_9FLAO|nr:MULTISPECIES: glycosyltransferase family 2 protein [Capnocytophaga]ATA72525.1 glycosyl transferase [Capnocytophaga sp. H4358]CEN43424.1 Glycosyltransferase, group 2 family protein [Capnocytophaga canis]CEN44386.1 Glycosyltransferase, group 2 family protein [Capnocytophaga canis]